MRIPFDAKGNLLHETSDYHERYKVHEWRENFVFDAGFAVMEADLGCSARNILLKNVDDGTTCKIMLRHFMRAIGLAIPSKRVVDGEERLVLSYIWTYHRGGNHYFVKPVVN